MGDSEAIAIFSFGPVASEGTGYFLRVHRIMLALQELGYPVELVEPPKRKSKQKPQKRSPFVTVAMIAVLGVRRLSVIRRTGICWFEGSLFLPVAILARLVGKKVVFDSHCFQEREGSSTDASDAGRSRAQRFILGLANRVSVKVSHVTICVSEDERAYAIESHRARADRTVVVTNPVGGFANFPEPDSASHARPSVLFLGDMTVVHNEDALHYILESLAPELPWVDFVLVGRLPDGLQHTPSNVRTTGYVEDLSTTMAGNDLFIAPHRFGSGTKTKVLAALAAGLPVLASPCGAEGIDLPHDGSEGLWVEEMASFPDALTSLLQDRPRLSAARGAGRSPVLRMHGPEALKEGLQKCLSKVQFAPVRRSSHADS